MFYYTDQSRSPSFSIGLVKTKSDFIVRSVETGFGRWTLVVVVINVDAYLSFGFLRPDLSPWGYTNRCLLVALCCLIVRRPNFEEVTKRHQQTQILGCSTMFAYGSASLQLLLVVWIFLRSQAVICYNRWVLSEGH